ncbi:MAG: ribonuclease J [Firmicutes bacterium HGW-Firmicutes-16]|nr:MAG: ribonuclease J [Firmicutes bacterium HGW-Firmicutes-16]
MASKLKIISLGGLNEIGKNLTVYEYGDDIIVVDCGLGFPDEEMYGVDIVIPDFSYLVQNQNKIRAIILTHGHEDHIGGLPFLMREINAPLFTTRLTAGLIELKLEEHGLKEKVKITTLEAGEHFKAGCFNIELIHVNHSIADAVALAIKTPIGTLIHTGDFKIDATPIEGEMIDLTRLGEIGKEGVLMLLSDSTNVEKPGYSESEKKVGVRFDALFKDCDKRIIVTTFASNVHRVQQIINSAAKNNRKVAITGRSMENIMRVAMELGYMEVPKDTLIDINQINTLPKNKLVIITTGSQGENMSALYRMAFSGHRQVEINAGDRVIISASAIPGNEKTISRVINELFMKGAEVIYDRLEELHVSGHACREELKMMLALTKPRYFMPLHGEQRHLRTHAELAKSMGIDPKNIVIGDIGRIVEVTRKDIKLGGTVQSGKVLVDGTGVGDVGSVVLRDRRHLAQDGMVVVVMTLSSEDASLISGPDIVTRGFVYVKESDVLLEELKRVTLETLDSCENQHITDWATIKTKVKTNLSGYLYKTTKRSPMILPVIMEV